MTISVARSSAIVGFTAGLHLRVVTALSRLVADFESDVVLGWQGKQVDVRNVVSMLTLAVDYGAEVEIQATGRDALETVDAVISFLITGHQY